MIIVTEIITVILYNNNNNNNNNNNTGSGSHPAVSYVCGSFTTQFVCGVGWNGGWRVTVKETVVSFVFCQTETAN
jgi:hypothetical protein